MKKSFIIISCLFVCNVFADKREELQNGLEKYYHIEASKTEPILKVFKPLLDDPTYDSVIDDFLSQSKVLHIDFSNIPLGKVYKNDPVVIAPEEHCVLYENAHVRVLMGDLGPNQLEVAHQHFWKRILVIIYGAKFKIISSNCVEVGEWPPGSYLLDPENEPFSSLNLSDHFYRGITFEIKE